MQAWWLEPVLTRLGDYAMVGATLLTAFNDNAAVPFLASTVPNLPEAVKYSVVAGAVTGGGLTVIATAPNPAGPAILGKYFKGINPLWQMCIRDRFRAHGGEDVQGGVEVFQSGIAAQQKGDVSENLPVVPGVSYGLDLSLIHI